MPDDLLPPARRPTHLKISIVCIFGFGTVVLTIRCVLVFLCVYNSGDLEMLSSKKWDAYRPFY